MVRGLANFPVSKHALDLEINRIVWIDMEVRNIYYSSMKVSIKLF